MRKTDQVWRITAHATPASNPIERQNPFHEYAPNRGVQSQAKVIGDSAFLLNKNLEGLNHHVLPTIVVLKKLVDTYFKPPERVNLRNNAKM